MNVYSMCSPISRGSILPISATTAFKIENARLQHLHAAERQQLARHRDGPPCRLLNLLHAVAVGFGSANAIEQQVGMARG